MIKERFSFTIGQDTCYMIGRYDYVRVQPDGTYFIQNTKKYSNWFKTKQPHWAKQPTLSTVFEVIDTVVELGLPITVLAQYSDGFRLTEVNYTLDQLDELLEETKATFDNPWVFRGKSYYTQDVYVATSRIFDLSMLQSVVDYIRQLNR